MNEYGHFIPQNTAPPNARRIGIYDSNGNRVGQIPLGSLTPPNPGSRLYSFGVLSDVHIGESTADTDFQRALTFLGGCADFVCISGDLAHTGTQAQRTTYKSIVDNYSTIPVYACGGNHDGEYVPDLENVIASYTGQPLYYSVARGDDVFIFVGNATGTAGKLFTEAELQWLYETLEANRNKRCFLFQHVRPDDGCGNALGIYTFDIWAGNEATVFESLLRQYPNVVFFHGHSHLKFYLQQYSDIANIDRNFGCWSVHVPSLAVPRDTTSVVNPTRVEVYAASEGYLVDVYPDGIHLRGRDFVKGEFLPIASYWLETELQAVEAGTYTDSTGTITI